MGFDERFVELTEPQQVRDSAIVEQIRAAYIEPLLTEINEAIPDYANLDDWGKFLALMRLNEEVALKGDCLMLDFGWCSNEGRAYGAVYSGDTRPHAYQEYEGTKVYTPFYLDSDMGIGSSALLNNVGYLLDPEVDDGSVYSRLPLPFKVAVLALYLRQNVLVTLMDSCRLAAGMTTEISCKRWLLGRAQSEKLQNYGWILRIRDTMPSNEMVKALAHLMRWNRRTAIELFGPTHADGTLLYADEKQKRSPNKSTELLIDFVERDIPSRGLHVGRKGSGEPLSWDKAYLMFNELHPDIYSSTKSFRDSYYNAKKAREQEGGPSNATQEAAGTIRQRLD